MRKNVVLAVIEKHDNDSTRYLLVRVKRDFGKNTGYLQPVGGHVEDGENENAALKREIFEELGVGSQIEEKIATTKLDINGELAHWYTCKLDSEDFRVDTNEISSLEWLTLEDIKNEEKIWPSTKNFLINFASKSSL